jgi:hypothetical protein
MTRHIDWRRQFQKLQPYLDGQGGVVNLRYRGDDCGINAFLAILKSEFAHRISATKNEGVSIRLDPDNYKVRHLAGIRGEFARLLGQPAPAAQTPPALPIGREILSGNMAGGDQRIEAHLYIDNDPHLAIERNAWAAWLALELRAYLEHRRLMLVLWTGASKDQSEFWSCLWTQINELTRDGLLLIRMIDDTNPDADLQLGQCHCNCEVRLTAELVGDDVKHAIEDVARLIIDMYPDRTPSECELLARGYVLGQKDNVSMLHNGLLTFTSSLGEY